MRGLVALVLAIGGPAAVPVGPLPAVYYSDTSRLGRPFAKDPSVIRFGDRYLMYYSLPPSDDPQSMTGWAIGIAASRDLAHWHKIGEMLPSQPVERNGIAAPGAVVIKGRIHLFYQTYGNGRRDAINHAISRDGVRFDRDASNPVYRPADQSWSSGRAIDAEPFVNGDTLRLYYATRDPAMKRQMIGVAETSLASGFGRGTWRDVSGGAPILAPERQWERDCVEAPSVIRRKGTFYMFYAGGYNNEPQQIGVATSRDGLHWRRQSNVPVLAAGGRDSWNASESGHPGVFVDRDRAYLFYQGNADQGHTWGIARADIDWAGRQVTVRP